MKSHEYQFTFRDLCRVWLPTLVVLGCVVAALKLTSFFGLMPVPAAGLDPNTALLAHQARAARSYNPAEIVLLGDSTCLVGVDAAKLSRKLHNHPPTLSLALLIWFDLEDYAELLAEFASANPGQVRTIILLVTPEKLSVSRNQSQEDFWRAVRLDAQGLSGSAVAAGTLQDWFGFRSLRKNLFSHVLATPLRGKGAGIAYFGFSSELDAYMTAHQGSSLDFGPLMHSRSLTPQNWAFADDLESESRAFRAKIPPGAKLFVGLTPLAQSYCSPTDRAHRLDILRHWDRWIQADALLTNLPPSLPDAFFASKGHLNEEGQERFTAILSGQTHIKVVKIKSVVRQNGAVLFCTCV